VRRWITEGTPSPTSAARIASTSARVADSPSSSDFVSTASTTAITTSSTPIPAEPIASQRPSSVTSVIETPNSAMTRPISAPKSSSSTTGSSGAFAVRMYCTQDCFPRVWFASRIAVRKDSPSITIAASSTTIGTQCQEWIGCGSANLCHASYSANSPPRLNSTIDTMNAYM
jgi:hypothetical protein